MDQSSYLCIPLWMSAKIINLYKPFYWYFYALILISLLSLSYWSTCSTSELNSNSIETNIFTFSGYTAAGTYKIIDGPISESLYYLIVILNPYNTVVRKVSPERKELWITAIGFRPLIKALSIDDNEQHLLFASYSNPLVVWRLSTSTGAIVGSQKL